MYFCSKPEGNPQRPPGTRRRRPKAAKKNGGGGVTTDTEEPRRANNNKNAVARTKRNADERAKYDLLQHLKDIALVSRLLFADGYTHVHMSTTFSLLLQTVNVLPWELRQAEDALIALLLAITLATEDNDNRAMIARGGAKGSHLEEHFPRLHAKLEDGSTLWSELQKGRFKGVDLEMAFKGDDGADDQYALDEWLDVMVDEAHDFTKALHHYFMVMRCVKCKGAPRQGEKGGGHQAAAAGGLEARKKVVETAGQVFDLRKLCVEPCELLNRVEALRSLHAAATDSGVEWPSLPILELQLAGARGCARAWSRPPSATHTRKSGATRRAPSSPAR